MICIAPKINESECIMNTAIMGYSIYYETHKALRIIVNGSAVHCWFQ